jgi:hypothetical protein
VIAKGGGGEQEGFVNEGEQEGFVDEGEQERFASEGVKEDKELKLVILLKLSKRVAKYIKK